MRLHHLLIVAGLLLVAVSAVMGVAAQDPPLEEDALGERPTFLGEVYDAWAASPHADFAGEPFRHWDEDGVVEAACATCHSTSGYQDFLGADGTAAGVVDADAPLGSVVNCEACHNSAAASLMSVTFPSGVELSDVGASTRCMVCHQGRASGDSVVAALEEAALPDMNTPSADLRFINIHYYAAAASLYGGEVRAGYHFEGKNYQLRSDHVEGYNTCADCHDPHTLEVKLVECTNCHENASTIEDVRAIRMQGSMMDYDGDGDMEEGMFGEIETLQALLYAQMQSYAANVAGTPLAYDTAAYPYFFIDGNANGMVDPEEANRDNAYNAWTGNLLKAAYNYQVTLKDGGNYVHNSKYHIELLYDSIEMLMTEEGQMGETSLNRNDAGHFDSTVEAFRHWDADGEVPGSCAKCHTAEGLPTFLHNGTNIAVEPANSLECITCHDASSEDFSPYVVAEVAFPSGAKVSFGEDDPNNLCLNCHQGRESTVSVDRAISGAGVGDDEVSEALRFRNVHYFAAGATLFGSETQGAYQYADQEYNGRFEHARSVNTCTDCHDTHAQVVQAVVCEDCHDDVDTVEEARLIRFQDDDDEDVVPIDYDGDGDLEEPIADEIAALEDDLMVKIMDYAANTLGSPILYDSHAYPYWFNDLNANGTLDPDEANPGNQFASWSPTLLRAAYNYQYVAKDPGAYAHNADYILQVLYDSLAAIGGPEAVATYTRPPVVVAEE
jgi:Zn finger protein HypA/HybF involved in hydrogenase expression